MGFLAVVGAVTLVFVGSMSAGCAVPDVKRWFQSNVTMSNGFYDQFCPDSPEEKARRAVRNLKEGIRQSSRSVSSALDEALKDDDSKK